MDAQRPLDPFLDRDGVRYLIKPELATATLQDAPRALVGQPVPEVRLPIVLVSRVNGRKPSQGGNQAPQTSSSTQGRGQGQFVHVGIAVAKLVPAQ